MSFCFYPTHSHGCEHVSHFPHLDGAALGTVVLLANENDESLRYLHRTIDAERERNTKLFEENERLKQEPEQVKLELKLKRQNKFATNQQKEENSTDNDSTEETAATKEPKKRGARVGHPGWFRPTPTHYDWAVNVPAPCRCRTARGTSPHTLHSHSSSTCRKMSLRTRPVSLSPHETGCCDYCGRWVAQAGKDEILNSRIGPCLRSTAIYLRHVIGISY